MNRVVKAARDAREDLVHAFGELAELPPAPETEPDLATIDYDIAECGEEDVFLEPPGEQPCELVF